ncbi:MAG: SBBP repeat-containing protein, partial [Bacteroidia bacterium]|nr:SBBP repeat-containing protein [Bacteroidia bacterium]
MFVAGETVSNNGIGAGGFQNTFGGARDAFLVKFNSAGTRMWGTFYGGTGLDGYGRVAADGAGNVYLAGQTQSTIGIAMGGFQNTYVGGQDAFLVKFNSTGTRIWATYYGGSGIETWPSIAVDGLNNVYLGGYTASTTGIFSVGFQNTLAGGIDAFLVKFDAAGNRLWATYYGGPGNDWSTDIATDALNNIYLAGFTTSTTGIASGGFQNTISGGGAFGDAYLIKFNPSGSRLWGTYYGANDSEISYGVATDVNNNVYLLLEVEDVVSPNLTDACAYQTVFNGGSSTDPFSGANGKPEDQQIVKFKPTGEKICVTYMGGPGEDDTDNSFGGAIAINGTSLYIIGRTDGGYPVTPGAFQTTFSGPFNTCNGCGTYGGGDAFVASLCTNICEGKILALNFTATTNNICANAPVFFTPTIANSCDTAGYKFHWIFTGGNPATSDSASPMVSFASVGSHDVKLIVTTPCKKDSITQLNYITTTQCTTCNLTG